MSLIEVSGYHGDAQWAGNVAEVFQIRLCLCGSRQFASATSIDTFQKEAHDQILKGRG